MLMVFLQYAKMVASEIVAAQVVVFNSCISCPGFKIYHGSYNTLGILCFNIKTLNQFYIVKKWDQLKDNQEAY